MPVHSMIFNAFAEEPIKEEEEGFAVEELVFEVVVETSVDVVDVNTSVTNLLVVEELLVEEGTASHL